MNVQVLNNLPKHLHCHMFRRTRAAGLYRNGVELEMISVISFEPPVIISFLDAGSIISESDKDEKVHTMVYGAFTEECQYLLVL